MPISKPAPVKMMGSKMHMVCAGVREFIHAIQIDNPLNANAAVALLIIHDVRTRRVDIGGFVRKTQNDSFMTRHLSLYYSQGTSRH